MIKSKALGTIVDQHLSRKPDTENICKKITSGISALRCVKPFIAERGTLISIYNAIVPPYFDYLCEVWDVFGEIQSKRLQKLQNRVARIISSMSNDVDHSVALHVLGWEPLHITRKKAKATFSLSHGRYFRQFWGTATFTSESLHAARCNSLYL